MGKVISTASDVIVVLRHDPNSSDAVEAGMVLATTFFNGVGITVPDDDLTATAEAWAVLREINYMVAEAETENFDQAKKAWARSLIPENFTKQTDVWFEAMVMPVFDYEAEAEERGYEGPDHPEAGRGNF